MATENGKLSIRKSKNIPSHKQALGNKDHKDIKRRGDSSSKDARLSPRHPRRTMRLLSERMDNLLARAKNAPRQIPEGLSPEQTEVYRTLDQVVKTRRARREEAPHLVVITDLAKDYDDLAAMVVLKELHRLGLVVLEGFIANLDPAEKRAQFGRGALDSLGLEDIPIAIGSDGGPNPHKEYAYEFDICKFMAEKKVTETGDELLTRLFKKAEKENRKLKLVLLSSLKDIEAFVRKEKELFLKVTQEVVLQGGYLLRDGVLEPDKNAANNNFDIIAATQFHHVLQENKIRSTAYTKVATFATPITTGLFVELAKDGHIIGQHLRKVQAEQDFQFYSQAAQEDPSKRFRDWMDAKWYLTNKTDWFKTHTEDEPYPKGKEVIPYLTRAIAYDALPAVGSAGDDALQALGVLSPSTDSSIHKVVGVEPKDGPKNPGVNGEKMSLVITTLLKGSLLASLQNPRSP